MAHKDEYEVARLHTDAAFLAKLDALFPHGYAIKYNLAPPSRQDRRASQRAPDDRGLEDYIQELDQLCSQLSPANHAAAAALASVPNEIRGYGHAKEQSIAVANTLREERLRAFRNPQPVKLTA